MRILFLTNFYPPYARGGEEYSCQQVADGLRCRQHEIYVLTSTFGTEKGSAVEEEMVSRSLFLEMDFLPWVNSLLLLTQRKARERHNLQRLRHVLNEFKPDLVFVWGMWNLPRSLPRLVEELCVDRVVYRFATYWPALPSQFTEYWRAPGRTQLTRVLRRLIRPLALTLAPHNENHPPLQFRNMICVSEAVKKQLLAKGIDASQARIIYTGLDTTQYQPGSRRNEEPDGRELRLLYSGRLAADKGVHTAIQAMHVLINQHGFTGPISLSVAGAGDSEYESKLRTMVNDFALSKHVTFLGQIPQDKMAALYSGYNVLVVPSIWPEPFARVVLEGMASGLAVISTPQGGTVEIIRDDCNGLLFDAGDAGDLANKILMLHKAPEKRFSLAAAARQTVLRDFGEQAMLDQLESYLLGIINSG